MANSILAGFVKGYTDRELDRIDQRRKAEAEEKKLRLLQQLEKETQEWKWQRDPELKSRLDSEKQRRELAASAEARAIEEHPLSLAKTRADIDQSRASAEASRASAGYSRAAAANLGKKSSGGGSLDSSSGEGNLFDIANELVDQFKGDVATAKKKGITDSQIMDLAIGATNTGLRSGATTQERIRNAQERFRNALKNLTPVPEDDTEPKFIRRGLGG